MAVNIFLRQAVRENGIPFAIKLNIPNAETRAAIKEGDILVEDINTKRYSSIAELREDLDV